MYLSDQILGISFFSQTVVSVLGNSAMFLLYIHIFMAQSQQKWPMYLILTHLTVANTMTLLIRGVLETMVALGIKNILGDIACKVVLYISRVARGLSFCITCLLSVFQAVTISPSTTQVKPRALHYILPSFFIFWILNLVIYIILIKSAQATKHITIIEHILISKYCSVMPKSNEFMAITPIITTFRDVILVCLMSWASGYMVIVLHRHHQVQHIHSTSRSPKYSTETRAFAIHTILLLVTCSVCFYWLDSFMNIYLRFVKGYKGEVQTTVAFLSTCFPSISPLVLIIRHRCFPQAHSLIKKVKCSAASGVPGDTHIVAYIRYLPGVLCEDSSLFG
ncbi:olfactory receptor class A-like protein 1 [Tachyglossus aculeatus]|uniref:olfactory receptor class A-like protein 1 n=1 Tax=Tachyglossus aculeatus TaxID=9261 RepID=UPI0018F6310A|nr:olfactory receptor class A-like protein 1 [Tachyglossus aculeatus]